MTSATLIDAIRESMAASLRGPDGAEPPAALLWTDPDGQWQPLIPALMKASPELYALGAYAPAERRGPAIWIKCVVERTLPDAVPEAGATPVLYLPEVGRQTLRAADDCDAMLQPLVELQYRGAVWHQRNGRDWTVEAFLASDDALGLDVSRDATTRAAALRALPLLAAEPVAALRGRRLEAEDFDRLSISDPVRDLLTWMSDAAAFEADCDSDRWSAFRDVCRHTLAFDPDTDGLRTAADALAAGGGKWNDVWRRFCDAPLLYSGISAVLHTARPKDLLHPVEPSRRPDLNEEREDRLRAALEEVAGLPHADACDKVAALDDEHGQRRGWVWARLGQSPCALALEPLGRLARTAKREAEAASAEALAADYAAEGWRCDRAAVEALSCLELGTGRDLVVSVVRALYEPWLDRTARKFQDLLSAGNTDPSALTSGVDAEPGVCILFADGLRFDLGAMLGERLEARGVRVRLGYRMAPIPTVTATAKPLASPVHAACAGAASAEDFCPTVSGDGKPATAARLRALMAQRGIAIPEAGETPMALDGTAVAWMETGRIDTLGHSLSAGLACQIDMEIDAIADRVDALLAAGWRKIRVVTDHGWLLLAGGLPRVDLPLSLVETKWSRCAAVRGESEPAVPTYPWYWNPSLRIASPPGIGAFRAGVEYAHGGVSPQECVVPDLIAERNTAAAARITDVVWRGMRCRIAVDTGAPGAKVDLRLNRRQAKSSIVAAVRALNDAGETSLVVADDEHEGAAALVVVLDEAGQVLDDRPTIVGDGG